MLAVMKMSSHPSQSRSPVEKRKSVNTWSDDFLQGGDDNIFGNALFRNLGYGRFDESSDALGVEN